MKSRLTIVAFAIAAVGLLSASRADAQVTPPPIRRALPVQQPQVRRALPAATPTPATPTPTRTRALPVPAANEIPIPAPPEAAGSGQPSENDGTPEQQQLNYANGLLSRKLYDLAIPEY